MKQGILLRRTPVLRAVAIARGCYGPRPFERSGPAQASDRRGGAGAGETLVTVAAPR
jgi:hypothetical protein